MAPQSLRRKDVPRMNYKRCRAKKQDFSEFSFFFARRGVFRLFSVKAAEIRFICAAPAKKALAAAGAFFSQKTT